MQSTSFLWICPRWKPQRRAHFSPPFPRRKGQPGFKFKSRFALGLDLAVCLFFYKLQPTPLFFFFFLNSKKTHFYLLLSIGILQQDTDTQTNTAGLPRAARAPRKPLRASQCSGSSCAVALRGCCSSGREHSGVCTALNGLCPTLLGSCERLVGRGQAVFLQREADEHGCFLSSSEELS